MFRHIWPGYGATRHAREPVPRIRVAMSEPHAARQRRTTMMSITALAGPTWLVATVLLVAACAQAPDGGTGAAAQPPADRALRVDGRTFASVHVSRAGAPVELVPTTQIRLSFSDRVLTAHAGCNTMSANATYDDDVLRIDGSLGMTEMGCDGQRQAQDEWLASVLMSRPRMTLEGNELTISRRDLVIELRDIEVLEPDRPLVATPWVLQSIGGRGSQSSVSSVSLTRPPTLVFTRHRASIFTACNHGSAQTAVSDGVVSFSNVTTTLVRCIDERADVEKDVMAVLEHPCRVDVTGDTLTLTSRGGTLSYTAA